MKDENTAVGCSSYDALTDLKPCGKQSLERQYATRGSLLAGSNSSYSSNETRRSRFNDRPVIGSPMYAARECFSRKSEDSHIGNSLWDELNVTAKTLSSEFENSVEEKKNGMKVFKQRAMSQIETAKDLFEKRMRRIDSSFFSRKSEPQGSAVCPEWWVWKTKNWSWYTFVNRNWILTMSHYFLSIPKLNRTLVGKSAGGRRIWICLRNRISGATTTASIGFQCHFGKRTKYEAYLRWVCKVCTRSSGRCHIDTAGSDGFDFWFRKSR